MGVVGGALSGRPSGVSIGVSTLSLIPVGSGVVSGVRWTMKLLIKPPIPGGFGFGGLRLILFLVKRRSILE